MRHSALNNSGCCYHLECTHAVATSSSSQLSRTVHAAADFLATHPLRETEGLQTGWPDWAIFLPVGRLLEAHYDFLKGWSSPPKDEVAQNNDDFLGYFLFKQMYYVFT